MLRNLLTTGVGFIILRPTADEFRVQIIRFRLSSRVHDVLLAFSSLGRRRRAIDESGRVSSVCHQITPFNFFYFIF